MRRLRLLVSVALVGAGCTNGPVPNKVAAWTYPVWGLPRDLADAPLTAINRTGFGSFVVCLNDKYTGGALTGTFLVADTAGIIAWIQHGFGAAVVTELAFIGYGLLATFGGDLVYGAVVNPLQVALLRTGFDDRYFKYGDHDKGRESTPEETDARERSRAFFPNWRSAFATAPRDVDPPATMHDPLVDPTPAQ